MPHFGQTSRARLEQLDIRLAAVLERVIPFIDFTVLETHRSKEKQNKYYKEGRSKLAYPGSKHNSNPSKAVDVAQYYKKAPHVRWTKEAAVDFAFLAGTIIGVGRAMGVPIRWGGDWNRNGKTLDEVFHDLPHLEIDE